MQIRISEPVLSGLKVIETMRAEPDGRIARWFLHLDRLRRDCAMVGFALDEDQVQRILADLPRGQNLRVRLTVDANGQVEVAHQPLPPNPAYWTVMLSPVSIDSGDPWLRIKSTYRVTHDAARAAMPKGYDETILMNERGEICEGTITNVFLRRKGRLLTPPVSCGLLPGVLRQSLLDRGDAQEAVLSVADLNEAELFCGNALRGLIPAKLSPSVSGS